MVQNRLTKRLNTQSKNILSLYWTAGYPKLNDTVRVIEYLEKAGADAIEVGMPFSDPLADGPTIQMSNSIALQNGIHIPIILEQLKNIRQSVQIPIILMGYLNPVLQFGIQAFCEKCAEIGIDGLIIPDLPLDIYMQHYQAIFENHNISNICLITPRTSAERIKQIDENSSGFIYAVSGNSTTGNKAAKAVDNISFFENLQKMSLKNPVITGFNIKDKASFDRACQYTNGAIIASALINYLKESTDLETGFHSKSSLHFVSLWAFHCNRG